MEIKKIYMRRFTSAGGVSLPITSTRMTAIKIFYQAIAESGVTDEMINKTEALSTL
jgi:hypothetical protein